jgi:CubicO group peptidase (beta-lactamase class C family)
MTPRRVIAASCALALLTAAACRGSDDDSADTASPATAEPVTNSETATEPEPEPEAEQQPITEPTDGSVTETETEIETETETEPTTDPEPEPPTPPREYDFSAVSPIVQDFVDDRGLNGAGLIIVESDDGVIHHEHWGEFTEARISLVASSSKMITAGVLMHLDDDGVLDVDAPVADVVEWGAGNPGITPAQLVSNSSGLVGLLDNFGYGPYRCQWSPAGQMQECAEAIFTTTEDDGDVAEPDTTFRYGGAQWQIAGAVAEVASGRSWSQLVEEIYVEPCELEALGYNNHFTQLIPGGFGYPTAFDSDPSKLVDTNNPNMEGGAYVTTGDYGKLLLMNLRDGRCGESQVLSAEALARMQGDRIADAYDGDAYDANTGYGMGWWVDRTTGRITDPGAYGSVAWLDLADDYGAFLVIERDSETGAELAAFLYDVIDDAVNAA